MKYPYQSFFSFLCSWINAIKNIWCLKWITFIDYYRPYFFVSHINEICGLQEGGRRLPRT
jgi:hypothetical protein